MHLDCLQNRDVFLVNVEVDRSHSTLSAGLCYIDAGVAEAQQQVGPYWVELPFNALNLAYPGIQYQVSFLILS